MAAVGGVVARQSWRRSSAAATALLVAGVACVLRADYVCGDFEPGGLYQQVVDCTRETLEDRGGVSIHTLAVVNAVMMFVQVFWAPDFDTSTRPFGRILLAPWSRSKRRCAPRPLCENVSRLARTGFWPQIVARYNRHSAIAGRPCVLVKAGDPRRSQPMPSMVFFTVIHTVFGALVFASSILVVLLCYRLIPRRGTVAVASPTQTAIE